MKRIKLLSKVSLEQRIAHALSSERVTSHNLDRLIVELRAAITRAENEAEQAQARSLDPTINDPDARAACDDAVYRRDRLQAALPQLQNRHQQLQQHERKVRWLGRADQVEAKRNALAAEFAEGYPDLIDKLLDLFQRVQAINAEVDRINGEAPNTEGRRLAPIGKHCIPPNLKLFTAAGQQVWPPPAPVLLPQDIMPVLPSPGPNWWETLEARDRQRHADAQRIAEYHNRMAKEREDRDNAQARAARQRNGGGGP